MWHKTRTSLTTYKTDSILYIFFNTFYLFILLYKYRCIIVLITFHCFFPAHRVQQEGAVRQKEEEERQRHKALHYSEAIRQQMKERELSAIAKRRETFKEADQLIIEAQQRRIRLDEIKEKKLKELK